MNAIKKAKFLFLTILVFAAIIAGCTSIWKKTDTNRHFGTAVNHPTFTGPIDFFKSLGRVGKIFVFKRLDGGSVLRPWIDTDGWLTPAFREQLCLVVTLNNHCVG